MSGLDIKTCTSLLSAVNVFQSVEVVFAEWMFSLRTYVMWSQDKTVLAIILAASLIAIVAVTVLLVLFVPSIKVVQLRVSGITGCVKGEVSSILFATYLVIIAAELVILALIVTHVLRKRSQSRSHLLVTMMRDGVFYCVCMIAFSIVNVITTLCVKGSYSDLFNIYQTVFHTILASRLQLHLTRTNTHARVPSRCHIDTRLTSIIFEEGPTDSAPETFGPSYESDMYANEMLADGTCPSLPI
ncbi:hypothetical protein CONPUDRAFT_135415 [Coniophora puteana RWD-64-598 SS2]|uniref:Uncharacterized protein n=1 Tax=Coniophora puteana (strain RWD-64-598) TaxID=741705 RepID=A0A5M3MWT0_CONPW|nr:uncharacterized protein CONPUDRAFT_135415 [Coniophora puteana RWD-64-598 SS2]EIW83599.1 hypothetical protein CONPUDRAFT_135415 [Coniophora puteana RWD-64-598 SS2]